MECTVSVIIPLYDKKHTIKRALDSVCAQTFCDFEVIVINDGSHDDGPGVVADYNDRRIRLLHQENAGPGAARNRGIEEAQGTFITFLDADDEWMPQYLENCFTILQSHLSCEICVSAWYQECVCGKALPRLTSIIDLYRKNGIEIHDGPVNFESKDKHQNPLDLWWTATVCIRRSVLIENNYRFCAQKHYGEDFYLWLQLAFNHTVYRNCTPQAIYHNGSSEFARGLYRHNPIEAFLLWPEPIMQKTKPHNRKKLRRWLARYGLQSAHARLGAGQYTNALRIIHKHASMLFVAPRYSLYLLLKLLVYKIRAFVALN